MIAGTHGVEGHCGSGAQVAWLQQGGPARLPPRTGALLIHAINPHGFAWGRRVNEDNIDLNRNFVDHSQPHPANADYEALREHIAKTEFGTILGPIRFEGSENASVPGTVAQWQGGEFEVVWPKDRATAQLAPKPAWK